MRLECMFIVDDGSCDRLSSKYGHWVVMKDPNGQVLVLGWRQTKGENPLVAEMEAVKVGLLLAKKADV